MSHDDAFDTKSTDALRQIAKSNGYSTWGTATRIELLEFLGCCDSVNPSKSLTFASKNLPDLMTDTQVKNYFADNCKHIIRFVPGIGWHYWNSTRWNTNSPGGLHPLIDLMQRHLMTESEKIKNEDDRQKRRKSLIGWEMHGRQVSFIQACQNVPALISDACILDRDQMLFNVQNGTIDLRHGTIAKQNPDHLITRQSNIIYRADAKCPQFIKFVTWAMSGDAEMVAFIQRFFGYCLTGSTVEQKFIFLCGIGANGKSTLMAILKELLADYSESADTSLIMRQRSGGTDLNKLAMLAALRGARAVILSEVNDNERLDEAMVKTLTGGDQVTARFLHQAFFSYVPQFKLIGFGNSKPTIRETSHGIWRRFVLVMFRATCSEADKDPHLLDKLRAELPGILAWAVQGCLEWQRVGLSPPDAIKAATTEYRESEDTFALWLKSACPIEPGYEENAKVLLESYIAFSNLRNTSHKAFGKMLSSHGFTFRKSNGVVLWTRPTETKNSDESDFTPPFSTSFRERDFYRENTTKSHPKVTIVTETEKPDDETPTFDWEG